MNSFSERLKEERIRLGFNQADFAQIAGVQRRAQINYESGERYPDAKYLELVATVGLDVQYALTGQRGAGCGPRFTWEDVEKAGHIMLDHAKRVDAITIEDEQTYNFLHSLLMRGLTKVTGVKPPAESTRIVEPKIG